MGQWENIKQEVSNIRFGSKFDAVVAKMSRIFLHFVPLLVCSNSVACLSAVLIVLALHCHFMV